MLLVKVSPPPSPFPPVKNPSVCSVFSVGQPSVIRHLSSAVPSRLLSAFPDGTPVRRVTLEEAVTEIAGSHSALPTQRHLSHELDR